MFQPLDSQLCADIERVIVTPNTRKDQRILAAKFESGRGRMMDGGFEGFERTKRRIRPGLEEME